MRSSHARSLVAIAAIGFALLLAPAAQAHFEETNLNSARMSAGPFLVSFVTAPATLFQGASNTLSARVAPADSGTPYRGSEVDVTVTVTGPGLDPRTKDMLPDGQSYFLTTYVFDALGVHDVRIDVTERSTGRQGSATTTVEVFPDLPIRIRPIDTAIIVTANQSTIFDFEVVNSTLLTRDDRVQELTLRVEHWADDHVRKISEQEVVGQRVSSGTWRFVVTPDSSGMHHLRFASPSGGFNYAQSPPLHAYVDPDAAPPAQPEKGTPFPSVALVAVAGLGVALLFRRR